MTATLAELADGVFAWIHDVTDRFSCNIGVVVEADGLTVIDTGGVPTANLSFKKAIKRFGIPVTTIVLTNHHGDHVAGAASFENAQVICSAACGARLPQTTLVDSYRKLHPKIADQFEHFQSPHPSRIVTQPETTIGRIQLLLRSGQSAGDLIVKIADADTIFTGDLCSFGRVPVGIGANFDRWLETLTEIIAWSPAIVVPGHGPVGTIENVSFVREYIGSVIESAASGGPLLTQRWADWFDPWADRISEACHRINVEQARQPNHRPATLLRLLSCPTP
jgi:cyclase